MPVFERAGLLCVPVGGGPPASRPRREPIGSARRLEARPGPATAHGHRSQAHQSLRRPPHQWGWVADRCVVSKPGQAPPPPTDTAARPTTIPQHSHPAPHPSFPSPRPISHVIPLRLLQVLNSDRWNCNVFRLRYNFSQSNYVRLFWRVGPDARHGALASSTQSTATTITSSEPP